MMEGLKAAQFLPDAALCNICWDLFNDPVTLDCGHNYCSSCITRSWDGLWASCPQCTETVACGTLRPNRQLGNIAWLLKQIKLQGLVITKKPNQCETHHQPLLRYCKEDGNFLCSGCVESQVHNDHSVCSVELVAEEYKYEIQVLLEVQKLSRESIRVTSEELRLEKQNLVRLTEEGIQKFGSEYKELVETIRTVQIEQFSLAKQIEKEIDTEISALFKKRCNLKKLHSELQKKCQLPPHEFLKDIKQFHSTCREEAYQPLPCTPPAMEERLWDYTCRSLFLQKTLKQCRDSLLLQPKVEKATLTLDPATAFSKLLLSEDHKGVIHEPLVYSPVANSLGFDTAPCVLATEGFSMGWHCWEVEIMSEGEGWALGIAKESVTRKGAITLGQHEGIWALQPKAVARLAHKEETVRIRVYLHYEAGQLEFFDASSKGLLFNFLSLCFRGEKVFPFFMLQKPHSRVKLRF